MDVLKSLDGSHPWMNTVGRKGMTSPHAQTSGHAYFKRKLLESPNKKDTIALRHPEFPSQFKQEQQMYCFETFEELWAGFKKDHPAVHE